MAKKSEFGDFVIEQLASWAACRYRAMFGGFGLYRDDLMFGLIADDELYLKADAQSQHLFEDEGLTPFEFTKNGKTFSMSYYHAPEACFDDPDEMVNWAKIGWDAVLRNRKK